MTRGELSDTRMEGDFDSTYSGQRHLNVIGGFVRGVIIIISHSAMILFDLRRQARQIGKCEKNRLVHTSDEHANVTSEFISHVRIEDMIKYRLYEEPMHIRRA